MEPNDLPLLSNIFHWRARHYMLELTPDFNKEMINGEVIIFFNKPSECELNKKACNDFKEACHCSKKRKLDEVNNEDFKQDISDIILDCCDLAIQSIFEIKNEFVTLPYTLTEFSNLCYWNSKPMESIEFKQDKWSLTLFINKKVNSDCRIICIKYQTKKCGMSISWRKDSEDNLCFFTSASMVNNRSLFPGQDRPLAMATWQAWIMIPLHYYASMTGDENPIISKCLQSFDSYHGQSCKNYTNYNLNCFYYFTSMVLPIATIAIAVGKWDMKVLVTKEELWNTSKPLALTATLGSKYCHHNKYPSYLDNEDSGSLIPLTFVAPSSILSSISYLFKFTKFCLKASYNLLGRHPLKRLEIVILPRCFASLGLASPNLIFLSKTLLVADESSYIRIAHEISHTWFGIIIGAKDWREEWLSEGFATYLEDFIYAIAIEEQIKNKIYKKKTITHILEKYQSFFGLRSILRFINLKSELDNVSEELKILSPSIVLNQDDTSNSFITNGLNTEKSFTQVHYLKGYFLLRHFSQLVSQPFFLCFLKKFCLLFHGQLITSHDFVDFFFKEFPEIKKLITKEVIYCNWLCNSSINPDLKREMENIGNDNELISCTKVHLNFWNKVNICKGRNFNPNEAKLFLLSHKFQYSDQLVLLFEWTLEKISVNPYTLKQINKFYELTNRNAEIRHRWCELIIKNNFNDLRPIKIFLMEDQSMGVYLYGELMISNKKNHKKLVHDVFNCLSDELDYGAKEIIKSMIYAE